MAVKYHINPLTGAVGVCHATHGKCPFGGPNQHYATFSEAQEKADNIAIKHWNAVFDHGFSPDISVWNEWQKQKDLENKYGYVEEWSDEKIVKYLKKVKDEPDLIRAIWTRSMMVERLDAHPEIIQAALASPSLPDDIVDEVYKNPEEYSDLVVLGLSQNPKVPCEDIVQMLRGHEDTTAIRFFQNRNDITADDVDYVIDDMIENGTKNFPGNAVFICEAPHARSSTYDKVSKYHLAKYIEDGD